MALTAEASALVKMMQELANAPSRGAVIDVLKRSARQLLGSDGTTIVFRDGNLCYYVAEDAMAPLFAPGRFPMHTCVSGWCMEHAAPVVIADVYTDPRVPIEVYRPTFVKSMGMVPIRSKAPIGAIGFYWAKPYVMSKDELELAQSLADTAAVALHNVETLENLERRVIERTEQLELSVKDLKLFAGNVAHDLRSPLTVVVTNSRILQRRVPKGTDEAEMVQDMLDTSLHMNQMLSGLLELSQVTTRPLERHALDLSRLAEESLSTLRAIDPSRRIDVRIEPHLTAQADEGLMRIALGNLLNNAWKYTQRRDSPAIRFALERTDAGPAFVVADNGAGFDSEGQELGSAFKRFHTASEFPGTGLGLTTVYRAIHRHGGQLWARSKPNEGARFYFQLPGLQAEARA